MPTSRLRALSACSKRGLVVLQRERAAVAVLELPALGLQVAEQLERKHAGEPHGMERVGAEHVVEPGLERIDGDLARPAPVALLLRPADLNRERDALAAFAYADHLELRHQVLHLALRASFTAFSAFRRPKPYSGLWPV